MSNQYIGKILKEREYFTSSIDVQIQNQTPFINPVASDFTSLNVISNNPIFSYLNMPIKGNETISNVSILSFSLQEDTNNLLKKLQSNTYECIELKDSPFNNYNDYKTFLIDYIPKIQSKIVLNCPYIEEIINDISNNTFNLNIDALCINIYGLCSESSLNKLYNYKIHSELLRKKSSIIKLYIQLFETCLDTNTIENTFGSQLWHIDTFFQIALGNVSKVFVNMKNMNNAYSIMAFSYATHDKATFYTLDKKYSTKLEPNINIYATKNNDEYLITVIHKDRVDENKSVKINITTQLYNKAKLIRLISNQKDDGTGGITFGELTFDGSKDGLPIQARRKETNMNHVSSTIDSNNGVYSFVIDKMSVCILQIPIVQGGAYFDTINNEDEKNTLVTVMPDKLIESYDSIPTQMTVSDFKKINEV